MIIWIDIGHIAQLNFYSNIIKRLSNNNIILVTILNRGKLYKIAQKEIGHIERVHIKKVGKHRGTKLSAIIEANFFRLIQMLFFCCLNKPQFAISNEYLVGIVGKLCNIKTILFGDDIERKLMVRIKKLCSNNVYYALAENAGKGNVKVKGFNSLKEWAYLSPEYFTPNSNVLEYYKINNKEYIFVREVITGTLNYSKQSKNLISTIAYDFPENYTVLLSLEDKSSVLDYPRNWILLEEPLMDIHSLMYYSRLIVSSGDSMAREASMLGVPSIYCGVRKMNANQILEKKRKLIHCHIDEVVNSINNILEKAPNNEEQIEFREKLTKEWVNPTDLIINLFEKIKIE